MTAARDDLARLVTDALIAQGQDERFDAPYVKEESAGAVQVDGWVNPFELADEITKAGYVKPETVFVCAPDGSGGHEMDATALALIMANNTIARLTQELADLTPRVVTTAEEVRCLPSGSFFTDSNGRGYIAMRSGARRGYFGENAPEDGWAIPDLTSLPFTVHFVPPYAA